MVFIVIMVLNYCNYQGIQYKIFYTHFVQTQISFLQYITSQYNNIH